MTKLYNEVKDLNMEDAMNLLKSVSYLDLQREYKELADFKNLIVRINDKEVKWEEEIDSILPDSAEGSNSGEFVDTSRKCIIDGCENRVAGRAKKCEECKK